MSQNTEICCIIFQFLCLANVATPTTVYPTSTLITESTAPPKTTSEVPLLVTKLLSTTVAELSETTGIKVTPMETTTTLKENTTSAPVTTERTDLVESASKSSYIDEKIKSLSCEMPQLPIDAVVWTNNVTRMVSFPLKTVKSLEKSQGREAENRWSGKIAMQAGDMLLVEIDGKSLLRKENENKRGNYKIKVRNMNQLEPALDVTRPEYHDGKHIITLYDKNFNEGRNTLIVSSQFWLPNYIRLDVEMKSDNCGDDQNCSDKGICFSKDSAESYECQCCVGYIGPHCEERDACYPSPCRNNGICVDISQGRDGTTFQCLCPYGFTGKVCEDTSDPCQSGPCQNGGTCTTSNETAAQFKCLCPPGFKGPLCQQGSNHCASSPCMNGICVSQRDGFVCFCKPGYTGSQCQLEINECESSPCLNGGTCTDRIGSFSCACGRGYTGNTCRTKVNLCDPNPCSQHHYCIDKGNSYSCECPKGYIGPDCSIPMTKTVCNSNPCRNGGTCWSSIDSYYCACKPEYTGKTCTEKIVMEEIEEKTTKQLHKKEWVYEMPSGVTHVEHLYVAAGTLACALLIVILTVATCHCRMHETYKRVLKATPFFSCRTNRKESNLKAKSGAVKNTDKEPLSNRRVMAPVDYTDMYYAMDFSDSQSSPLIQ